MCGRFVLKVKAEEIEEEFGAQKTDFVETSFNIAPSQTIAAVREFERERVVSGLKWGLIPSWAKDAAIGNRLINARAESIAEKPSFRTAFKARRCLIPATGFYEWKRLGNKGKQPFYFYMKDKPVFGFAGLWEEWLDKETGELTESCTIITTDANEVLAPVHDRMPVIIKPENYEMWLDPKNKETEKLRELLKPYPAAEMTSHAVSRQVNSPSFNEEALINPVEMNSL